MKIQNPWIKLKETIDREDYDLLNELQKLCANEDQVALKLELDYKLGITPECSKISAINNINEFMYFDGQQLIGYIGICCFGGQGAALEVNGMVHPEFRRQGVFKALNELVMAEWKRRGSASMLLLCDRRSVSGQNLTKGTGAKYHHSEYEMFLKGNVLKPFKQQLCEIAFRKATNADTYEIGRQNAIYFGDEPRDIALEESKMAVQHEDFILPEEEEKKGMTIYLAEVDRKVVGKVHLQLISGIGGIYGLGVLPEYRGKGYGRAILMLAVEKLKEANAGEIMLQVAADNANALNLYKSCGFVETSTMDYYET